MMWVVLQGENIFKDKDYKLIMIFTLWQNQGSHFIGIVAFFVFPKAWVDSNPVSAIDLVLTFVGFTGEEKKCFSVLPHRVSLET